MHILLITHYFEPENGAPQQRWDGIIRRLVDDGHRVDVLAPPPHYPSGRLLRAHRNMSAGAVHGSTSGAVVHRVAFTPHGGDIITRTVDHLVSAVASASVALRLWRSQRTPDVVVATAPALESLVVGRALAKRWNLPFIAEMRDAWPDLVSHAVPLRERPRSPLSWIKALVHRYVTRLQRDASYVVTTTESFAAVLAQRGIAPIEVLRNATDPERFTDVHQRRNRAKGQLRVLYMGTVGRSQGLDLLVRAVAELRRKAVDIQMRIVGQGIDVDRLRRLSAELRADVEMLPYAGGDEVIRHYEWADTTVVSLRDWEPFAWTVPSKLYELLAVGKHITAVVDGEAAWIVSETRSGDVVSPGDLAGVIALWSQLAEDPDRIEVGASGREWVREHADYSLITRRYVRLLQQSIHSHGKRSSSENF